MKKKIFLSITLVSSLLISSCIGIYANTQTNEETTELTKTTVESILTTTTTNETVSLEPNAPQYSQSQLSPDYSTYETITLMDNNSKSSSNSVIIDSNVITINDGGTYLVSGSLSNGQIIIASEEETVQLVLDNATIHNETNPPIYIEDSKKYAMITLKDSSINTLTDGENYIITGEEDVDAVIYSKEDLIINGNGTLNVTANYNDAITSKDSLYIVSGTYNVTSKQDAFYGKDSITIDDGVYTVTTSTGADSVEMLKEVKGTFDGGRKYPNDMPQMERDNTGNGNFDMPQLERPNMTQGERPNMAQGERPDFSQMQPPMKNSLNPPNEGRTIDNNSTINSRPADRTTSPSKASVSPSSEEITEDDNGSSKAFKSKGEIVINNGTFILDTYDDSINANTFLEINNGNFTIKSGDDALKADYLLTINNGNITVEHSYEGIESKVIYFNGGDVNITSFDDGINASDPEIVANRPTGREAKDTPIDYDNDQLIYFNGTNVTVNGDGDSIDANGSILMNAGNVTIYGVNQGGELAVDFDNTGLIHGGNFLVLGGVASLSTDSTQNIAGTSLSNTINIGDNVKITDSTGNIIFETTAMKTTNVITFSSPKVVQGETYTIYYENNQDTITTSTSSTITNNVINNQIGGKGQGR